MPFSTSENKDINIKKPHVLIAREKRFAEKTYLNSWLFSKIQFLKSS